MPATIEDFDEYFEEMIYGGELWVTPRARELGKAVVLRPPAPIRMRWLVETVNFVIVGSLPGHIRKGYGLSWDPAARGDAPRRRGVHQAGAAAAAAGARAQHAGRRRQAAAPQLISARCAAPGPSARPA